jgi:penicillin G amidase
MLLGCVARHAARRRRVYALEERLAMLPREALPLEKQVVIHWNQHHVPFIEAMTDRDLAVALGIVHAHLRLGQLELMRRIARGRLSELVGPSGLAVDQLLRTLDVGRAVPEVLAAMPAATRTWLEAFVEGLNHQLMQVRPLPAEFDLFSLQQEPWASATF